MLTIHETKTAINTIDGTGSYWALNTAGKGRFVCTIEGDATPVKTQFAEAVVLADGNTWTMRDVIRKAQRGEMGLSIVEIADRYDGKEQSNMPIGIVE